MRKRRWLIPLCSVAAVIGLLVAVSAWLKARGERLVLTLGSSVEERPEHVSTDFPVRVDVVYNVSGILVSANGFLNYEATADFTFKNEFRDRVRIRLPLLGAAYWSPDSTKYIKHSELRPEWKQRKTIVLRKGETFTLKVLSGNCLMKCDARELERGFDRGRWALVFGVPDGEDPDLYLVGTVLTEPIHWQRAEKFKSY